MGAKVLQNNFLPYLLESGFFSSGTSKEVASLVTFFYMILFSWPLQETGNKKRRIKTRLQVVVLIKKFSLLKSPLLGLINIFNLFFDFF